MTNKLVVILITCLVIFSASIGLYFGFQSAEIVETTTSFDDTTTSFNETTASDNTRQEDARINCSKPLCKYRVVLKRSCSDRQISFQVFFIRFLIFFQKTILHVREIDPVFSYESLQPTEIIDGFEVHWLKVKSINYFDETVSSTPVWEHQVILFIPEGLNYYQDIVSLVDGGSKLTPYDVSRGSEQWIDVTKDLANKTNSVGVYRTFKN